ncbi:MAG TPA: EAL domain-containing protein [Caulobacteraceae bacterium]|jgi:EAL domain-containing protein (putative c-di-GMP-specific phosphodiesterase class I)/GGDEF domain-containing protein|nr:EAL domain-containing protein [Caulobacteraceae bacterium]
MTGRRLSGRLTRLYVGLFAAVLLLVSGAVFISVAANGQVRTRDTLAASGRVFDRLWELRAARLRTGASVLSRDFGFREALATRDEATIGSAAENLRDRLRLDLAFVTTAEGQLLTPQAGDAAPLSRLLAARLDAGERASGVAVVGGQVYQVVAAPVLAPDLIGWLVLAERVDEHQMEALQGLSALPLQASIFYEDSGRWRAASAKADPGLSRGVELADGRAGIIKTGSDLVFVGALPAAAAQRVALVLAYPFAATLAPFGWLALIIGIVASTGLALAALGGTAIARSVTGPLTDLTRAADRLQAGDRAPVQVNGDDEIGRLAATFNTMTDAVVERERRLEAAALTDAETGLPNRRALEQAVRSGQDAGWPSLVAAALGIARFAQVRAAIGYRLADELLSSIGAEIAARHPDWTVGRISTEALGIVVAGDPAVIIAEIDKERDQIERAHSVAEHLVDVKAAAGVAVEQAGGAADLELLQQAEIALDQARASRRPLQRFGGEAYARALAQLSLMPELRKAIPAGGLRLVHQPKCDLKTGAVCGVEALVRWPRSTAGPIPPSEFIPLAEETGDIRALTDWVVRQAIAEQRIMCRDGRLPVSVNLSGRLVGDEGFIDHLLELACGAAGPLCIEVTETAVIDDVGAALRTFSRLAEAGLSIAIDDFGAGLSSLAYLKQIPADELKLDRSLIVGLGTSEREALLVRSTIDLAHGLGMKVTAEGVEDAATTAVLARLGCDQLQGYHFARPMPADEAAAFIAERAPASALS